MRRVLIHQYETVLRFCYDVGVRHLPARYAERMFIRRLCYRCSFFGAPLRLRHDIGLDTAPYGAGFRHALLRSGPVPTAEHGPQCRSRFFAHRLLLPARHRSGIRRLCTALVARCQCLPQSGNDKSADPLGIAKAHFRFGRMDIHIDVFAGQFEEKRQHSVAIPGEHVGISPPNRSGQKAVLYRPAIDEEILMIGNAAVIRRQSGNPGQTHRPTFEIDGNAVILEFACYELCHPVRQPFPGLQTENASIAVVERDRNIGSRHGKSLHHILACGVFAARGA